jgi:hypothetical protein
MLLMYMLSNMLLLISATFRSLSPCTPAERFPWMTIRQISTPVERMSNKRIKGRELARWIPCNQRTSRPALEEGVIAHMNTAVAPSYILVQDEACQSGSHRRLLAFRFTLAYD